MRKITPYCAVPRPSFTPSECSQSPGNVITLPPAHIPDVELQPPSVHPDSGDHTSIDEIPASPPLTAGAETGTGQGDGLRRSSMTSRAPDRLQVQTWKGQTYVQSELPIVSSSSSMLEEPLRISKLIIASSFASL